MTTIQRWADLLGREVIQQPFTAGSNPWRPPDEGRAGHRFTEHDVAVLSRAVGNAADTEAVGQILWQRWGVVGPERFHVTWRQIIRKLENVAENGPAPLKAEGRSTPAKRDLGDNGPDEASMSGEAKAMAILIDKPEWTNKRIAQEVGVHEKTLSRYLRFQAARKHLKEAGRAALARGHKRADRGPEAYSE